MFDKNTYIERRHRLQEQLDSGLILLMGNQESPMNFPDNTYRFRQDSHFLYFFGLDSPGLAGLIDIDEQKTTIFGDELTIDHVVWMGPQPTIAERARRVGVNETSPYRELEGRIREALNKGRQVHFLPPYRDDNRIRLSQWMDIPINIVKNRASETLIKAVVSLVSIKSPEEVAEMEKAVNITRAMHLAAMRRARPGILEAELAGIVEGIALAANGQLSYPAILTVNGQTLHNHYHGNTLKDGQLVLGDFGAETATHYAGDITRTFPVSKTFSTRQKEIYKIVLDTEVACIEALKPGVFYRDVHLFAARMITEGLKALGIMKGDTEEAVQAGAHALFFPHGLGHMLGMDVHDMEGLGEDYVGYGDGMERSTQFGLKSLRLARKLMPGFVLTVEPGIYFIPELLDMWEKERKHWEFINYEKAQQYRDFSGVRIEDNVLITEAGHQILGRPIPKTIQEVEAERQA
ncbi:MAG: aminopeptidase P family protein [Phaeodactylibacter sp.]|nr:aminopeptidase P family protein [Phaeodactylibacter sp.]MCB9263734.1 aminopeptidase P family protein [Lewinellaceae bacterium]MCB9286858.1 aminopeptidase P family protein [Lewinellaceae bacterium]